MFLIKNDILGFWIGFLGLTKNPTLGFWVEFFRKTRVGFLGRPTLTDLYIFTDDLYILTDLYIY